MHAPSMPGASGRSFTGTSFFFAFFEMGGGGGSGSRLTYWNGPNWLAFRARDLQTSQGIPAKYRGSSLVLCRWADCRFPGSRPGVW